MHHFQASVIAICALVGGLFPPAYAVADGLVALRGANIETIAKAGTIEKGILLVRDGKIEAIGTDVSIPVSARVIDLHGMTIMPGLVDPYFVVQIGRNVQASATRTVVFQGRVFTIGGGSPAIATTFAKVADGINLADIDWDPARRSGITTMHVVTGGYAQSLVADAAKGDAKIVQPDGMLITTVSNETNSLNVLRNGLKEPSGARGGSSTGARSSASSDSTSELWKAVREGKSQVFVNVNNAAAILHTLAAVEKSEKAKVAFIASGEDIYSAIGDLDPKSQTVILAPAIDTIPYSRDRVNVPKLLAAKKIPFAFSTSLGQSDFRAQQDNPLFSVGMLVRSGLDRKLALQALTLNPAKLLGIDGEVGTLEVGKRANFLVLDGDPFATTTGIQHIFIDGKPIYEN